MEEESQNKDGHSEGIHWNYSGNTGPEHWGELHESYAACAAGCAQSPVDLHATVMGESPSIHFSYHPSTLRLVNNGHSFQVNLDSGSILTVDGHAYDLVQFHFHCPSEHTIDGRYFNLEIHLVHVDQGGHLAVVGLMAEPGGENATLAAIWPHFPHEMNVEMSHEDVIIDPAQLLPEEPGYYHYVGSLTTPPCTEGVQWFVMKEPVRMSIGQVMAFGAHYTNTNRPRQSLNGRVITEVH